MIDLCIKNIYKYKTFMKLIFMYNIYLGIDLCINDRFRYKKLHKLSWNQYLCKKFESDF